MGECKNTTENGNHCKSSEEIRDTYNGYWATTTFVDQFIDPNEYKNPRNDMLHKSSYIYVNIKSTELETDSGVLSGSYNYTTAYAFHSDTIDTFNRLETDEEWFMQIRYRAAN